MGAMIRARGRRMCRLCPPMRSTRHPETPFCELPHTSLGRQDNGQQASAVTPHFLCTQLSNHDRCRQCRRRHYQGPRYFLPAWPKCSPGGRGVAKLRHSHRAMCRLFYKVLYFCFGLYDTSAWDHGDDKVLCLPRRRGSRIQMMYL